MPKRDCAELHRRRNDLSCPQTIGEISRFARGDRESATTFSGVLDLLRGVVNGVRFCQRVANASSPDSVTKFGWGEIGRSGSSTSAAVSALSSRVKATLIVSTFSKAIADLRLGAPFLEALTCRLAQQFEAQLSYNERRCLGGLRRHDNNWRSTLPVQ
jgi:hypothetical protein